LQSKAGAVLAVPVIERLREDTRGSRFIEPDRLASSLKHLPAPLVLPVEFDYYTGWHIRGVAVGARQFDRQASVIRLDLGTTKNNKPPLWPTACGGTKIAPLAAWPTESPTTGGGTSLNERPTNRGSRSVGRRAD